MSRTIAKISLAILTNIVVGCVALADIDGNVSSELSVQLQQPVRATWEGQQLGVVLERIAASHGIAIWLDRRVDPLQEVSLRAHGRQLNVVLQELAQKHALGVATLESVVYLGPISAAIELATLHERMLKPISQAANQAQHRWLTPAPLDWPRLSEPRNLFHEWLSQSGIVVKNELLIPYDLWPEREFPAVSLACRVTLLLVGFNMTCEIGPDGQSCTVLPIRRPITVEQRYRRSDDYITKVTRQFPEARFTKHDGGFTLSSTWEAHAVVRDLLLSSSLKDQHDSPEDSSSLDATQRFSLKLENRPVVAVVVHLAEQLGLIVEWDADLLRERGNVKERLTSCEVKEVELEELLRCILEPVELKFRLEGKRLVISDAH